MKVMETDEICITQNEYTGLYLVTSTETCSKPLVTNIIYLIDIFLIVFIAYIVTLFFRKKIL